MRRLQQRGFEQLESRDLLAAYVLLETQDIQVQSQNWITFGTVLTSQAKYEFRASGTATMDGFHDRYTDAEWFENLAYTGSERLWQDLSYYTNPSVDLGLRVRTVDDNDNYLVGKWASRPDPVFPDDPNKNLNLTDHEYKKEITGAGQHFEARYQDNKYSDNEGSLRLQLYGKIWGDLDFSDPAFDIENDEATTGGSFAVGQTAELKITSLQKYSATGNFTINYDPAKVTLYNSSNTIEANEVASSSTVTAYQVLYAVASVPGEAFVTLNYVDAGAPSGSVGEEVDRVKIDGVPVVSIDSITTSEGDDAIFTVSLSHVTNHPVYIYYETQSGTALASSDYTETTGNYVTIAAGNTSAYITIPTHDDSTFEEAEYFMVNITSVDGALVQESKGTGIGTITDDDSHATINISTNYSTTREINDSNRYDSETYSTWTIPFKITATLDADQTDAQTLNVYDNVTNTLIDTFIIYPNDVFEQTIDVPFALGGDSCEIRVEIVNEFLQETLQKETVKEPIVQINWNAKTYTLLDREKVREYSYNTARNTANDFLDAIITPAVIDDMVNNEGLDRQTVQDRVTKIKDEIGKAFGNTAFESADILLDKVDPNVVINLGKNDPVKEAIQNILSTIDEAKQVGTDAVLGELARDTVAAVAELLDVNVKPSAAIFTLPTVNKLKDGIRTNNFTAFYDALKNTPLISSVKLRTPFSFTNSGIDANAYLEMSDISATNVDAIAVGFQLQSAREFEFLYWKYQFGITGEINKEGVSTFGIKVEAITR